MNKRSSRAERRHKSVLVGADGGMMKCHEMTQARMDMMIEMMDQMMQHQDAERAPEKKR